MTLPLNQANTSAGSGETWGSAVDKFNQAINAISNQVVTANTNANGSVTTGNAYINGIAAIVTLAVPTGLRGGNVQSSANLPVVSNVAIGNSTANVFIGYGFITATNSYFVGNSTVNNTINSSAMIFGTGTKFHSGGANLGNSTVNVVVNSSMITINGSNVITGVAYPAIANSGTPIGARGIINFSNGAGISLNISDDSDDGQINVVISSTGANVANATDIGISGTMSIGNSTVNSVANSIYWNVFTLHARTQLDVGANVVLSNTGLFIGNSTVNTVANSSTLTTTTIAAGTLITCGANVNISAAGYYIGNSTVNTVANSTVINTGVIGAATSVNVGANVNLSTSGASVGNSTVNVAINSSSIFLGAVQIGNTAISVGNSTVNTFINSTSLQVGQVVLDATASVVQSYITATTTGTSQQVIDNFTLATYRGAKYLLSIKDNTANGYQMAEVMVMHDGTGVLFTEYAMLTTNASLGVLTAGVSGANVQLLFTPVPANTTVKATKTVIVV